MKAAKEKALEAHAQTHTHSLCICILHHLEAAQKTAAKLGMSLDGLKHSDECRSNFTRWKDMNEFEALKYLDVSHEVHGGANDESRRSVRGRSYSPSLNVAPAA